LRNKPTPYAVGPENKDFTCLGIGDVHAPLGVGNQRGDAPERHVIAAHRSVTRQLERGRGTGQEAVRVALIGERVIARACGARHQGHSAGEEHRGPCECRAFG
jgi:hypothetical protein